MKLNPIQRFLKAMRDSVNEGIVNNKMIDLRSAVEAGKEAWDVCEEDDPAHSIADLVYRHMILEQTDGDAIILVGDEFPDLKKRIANEVSKRCYWLTDWSVSSRKNDPRHNEGDIVLAATNETVVVTSNANIYDEAKPWYMLKIEYMASSSRKTQANSPNKEDDNGV